MTTETHGMKFVVDASGVAKGFRDYKAAVDGIFASLDKFEAYVQKTMKGVASAANNKAALGQFRKGLEAFSNIKVDTSAGRKISALGAAMKDFRAPSASQTQNFKKFIGALNGLPNLTAAYRTIKSIDDLNIAMRGFKAPSPAQAKNLLSFARSVASALPLLKGLGGLGGIAAGATQINMLGAAMGRLKIPSSGQITNLGNMALALRSFNFGNLAGSANLFAALAAISNFKAPSAAQIKNLVNFIHAISTLKVPTNAQAVAAALANIGHAASSAHGALGGFRTNLGGMGGAFNGFSRSAKGASLQMMGLQNAMSGTFQIGSLLRSLFGALTIGEIGRNFFDAANAADAFRASMTVVSKDTGFAQSQLEYINETAVRFGQDILVAEDAFQKFAISANKSGASMAQTKAIYEGFSTAMTVMGTNADRQKDVFLALQQVMNKGYLASEELNQQLNEHLPGALGYLDKEVRRVSKGQLTLQDALKNKNIDAVQGLLFLASKYREEFGPAMEKALMRPAIQMTILKDRIKQAFQIMADSGAGEAFSKMLAKISSYLRPELVKQFAETVGIKLTEMVNKASAALDWLYVNWDKIKGPLATTLSLLGKWMVISGALKIGTAIVTPLVNIGRAAFVAGPLLWDLVKASKALAAVNLTGYLGALSQIKNPAIVNGVSGISNAMGKLATIPFVGPVVSGLGKIAGMIPGIATGFLGLAAAIGGGIAAAFGVAINVGRQAGVQMQSDQYTTAEIIYGMWLSLGDMMSSIWTKVSKFIVDSINWVAGMFGIKFADIGDFAATTAFSIYYVFKKTGDLLVKGFWSVGQSVGRTIGSIADGLWSLVTGDFKRASQQAQDLFSGNTIMGPWKEAFGNFRVDSADMASSMRDAGIGGDALLATFGARGRKGNQQPVQPGMAGGRIPPPATSFDDLYDENGLLGAGHGKKKKKKKGKDPHAEFKRMQDDIDAVMKKLLDGDAVTKLWQEHIADLTDEARGLMTKGSFEAWSKGLQQNMKDGTSATEVLIQALQKPGAISQKTLADLQARYGTDVNGIIKMLRAQEAEYEDAVKDATIKQMEKQYRQVDRLFKMLAKSNPVFEVMDSFMGDIEEMGKGILGKDAFGKWFESLKSGAIDGEEALKQLADAIYDLPSDTIDALTKKYGVSEGDLRSAILRRVEAMKFARSEAEEQVKFGATMLRQMREEGLMATMSDKQARITASVQEEVLRIRKEGYTVTGQMIDALTAEATAVDNLNEKYARQKEFFENNGIRGYINDVKSAGEAANELDKNVLQSLEDQLYSLGTTGKFSFKAIFDTIQQGIIRFSAQQVTKTLVGSLFSQGDLENGNPTMMGKLFGALGLGKYEAPEAKLGTMSNPMAVYVTNDGRLATGTRPTTQTGTVGLMDENGNFLPGGPSPTLAQPGFAMNANGSAVGAPGAGNVLSGPTNLLPGADPATTIAKTTQQTATSFQQAIGGVLPMIGLAFAGSFKSPIAQIGAMFAAMMIQKLIAGGMGGGGGGGGGLGGLLGSIFGGGGGGASAALPATFMGIYREGTANTSGGGPRGAFSPAAFANAPHYREGTPNTSGGMPAILHDNEAVIPLSRGRKVPVEIAGAASGRTVVNQTFNFPNSNVDGFRKSKQQVASDTHIMAARAYRRNN